MPIVRGPRPEDHYARIANEVLHDPRLSYRARGVAAAILARPDGWRTDIETLATQGKEGEQSVRTALRELETYGYSFMHKRQTSRGHWTNTRYIFDRLDDAREFAKQLALDDPA